VLFAARVAGSAQYTAIYSGFAVVILSLIWLQVAWLIVLIGGQVAYADQHPSSYAASRRPHGVVFRERIGLAALVEIARRHLSGQPPYRLDNLSLTNHGPLPPPHEPVQMFVALRNPA